MEIDPPQNILPNSPPQLTVPQALDNIRLTLINITNNLPLLRNEQIKYLQQPSLNMYNMLVQQQADLHGAISHQLFNLATIMQQAVISSLELDIIRELNQDLLIQLRQVEVYQEELKQCQQTRILQPIFAIVIRKQPFPMIVRKGKQIGDDLLVAQVLTGAYVNLPFEAMPPITATLLLDNASAAGGPALESNVQTVDSSGTAQFPLKFPVGTRKTVVHIKFSMSLSPNTAVAPIESEMTHPAIIITNECQWEGSLGMLMKREAFGGKLEVTWPLFINTLHRYFIMATKQDPRKPKRCLSQFDITYLHTHFFKNRNTVKQTEFDAFWAWFGRVVHLIRFQKPVYPLWRDGFIYGFMNREHTHTILGNNQPIGTFIIRFSERFPGQLDVAYVDTNGAPTHYLVTNGDINGPPKFADFLAEKPKLLYLLQLTSDANGAPLFLSAETRVALQAYVTAKPPPKVDPPTDGYVRTPAVLSSSS